MSPVESKSLLEHLRGLPTIRFAAGETLFSAGERSGRLLVLREGRVEVSSEGVALGEISAPGAVLGEMAGLLAVPHSADVRALEPTECNVVEATRALREDPVIIRHVAVLLAQRLEQTTQRFVALRRGAATGAALDQPLDQLAKALLLGGLV